MGHSVNYITCPNGKIKEAIRHIERVAFDPHETSHYHGNMSIHKNIIAKNREEAEALIDKWDTGWYSDHAVRFKEGRKYTWLIKYEYHC